MSEVETSDRTKLVIGIDEAGYGPNMGPLIIAASAWRVPMDLDVEWLSTRMEPEFMAAAWNQDCEFVPLGDSKKIYRSGLGIDGLAAGICFLQSQLSCRHESLQDWLMEIASEDHARVATERWYCNDWRCESESAPFKNDLLRPQVFERAQRKLQNEKVCFLGFRACIQDEREFNQRVETAGNKSNVLSEASLNLARRCIETFGRNREAIEVYCDKHGGRKKYFGLLMHHFEDYDCWFETCIEEQECSRYRSVHRDRSIQFQFKVEGDSLFPSAASSLVAKWLREIYMGRLNRFWCDAMQVPIRATAGYSVDAHRFAREIEPAITRLGLSQSEWWRSK